MMSTKQSRAKKVMASNDGGEDDDVGVFLIYRESQLRKKEAAAAAKRKKISSASTHQRTSTRKRPADNGNETSSSSPQRKCALNGRKRHSSLWRKVLGGSLPKRGTERFVLLMGAQILLRKEELAIGMGQRRRNAAVMDARINLSREECA